MTSQTTSGYPGHAQQLRQQSRPRPAPASTTMLRIVASIWLCLYLPASAVMMFIGIFAFSPTECPDTGGSYLCQYPNFTLVSLAWLGAILLVGFVLAIIALVVRPAQRGWWSLLCSVLMSVSAFALIIFAANSWS